MDKFDLIANLTLTLSYMQGSNRCYKLLILFRGKHNIENFAENTGAN